MPCSIRFVPRCTIGTMADETMSRILVMTMLALSLLAPPASGQPASTARGQDLLEKNCSRCHAVHRTGASPHADAPPFRTLARKYPIEGLSEALAEGLSVGHPDMPEFAFAPDEVGAILEYLKSIQER
jgi:mono/diheme cytochrome c family protein